MHVYEVVESQHEGQVYVWHTVTDVDCTVNRGFGSVVRVITGPEVTTESSNSAARVHNNAPALVRFVFRNAVQKVAVVNSLITSDELFLRGVFNLSEVLPVGEVHRFFNRESLECFIALNLLERSELHAPFRYGSAL